MSPMQKRKRAILDSDDEEIPNPKPSKIKQEMNKTKTPKKKKRLVLGSENESADESISDIKKNAKKRAKELAEGGVSEEKTTKKPKPKTPPVASNNILNYFKPRDPSKTPPNASTSKPSNGVKQEKDEDGYTYTQVSLKSDSIKKSPKKEKLTTVESSSDTKRKHPISPDSKKKDSNSQQKKPIVDDDDDDKISKPIKVPKVEEKIRKDSPRKKPVDPPTKLKSPAKKIVTEKEKRPPALPRIIEPKPVSDLWVDKHKPNSLKQIIGQQGDRSAMKKLTKWLNDWHKNLDKKPGFGKWGSDDGAGFRAALLSGPPGIGKTTTAQLVCQELGYDYLELNASASRNKRALQDTVDIMLKNTKLTDFFTTDSSHGKKDPRLTARHCLIMDEVDGIAGNEDRGGVAELIQLIKHTKIPIICICNDRGHTKIRSLVNYCFDLRFPKPKLEQVKGTLMSIAFKEQLKISGDLLNDLIVSSNFDIRQCIHNLYLLANNNNKNGKMITVDDKRIKDVRLSPFEAVKKVFCTGEDYARMSFIDKSDLFFCDYSIMPLFVYENYISINLASKQSSVAKQFKRLYRAIDSISLGDLVEKQIRSNQAWSLLPLQAAFSTVMPGSYMRSADGLGFPQFPQFMGKLSTTNKNNRIVDELVSHMKLSITGSKQSLVLDYLQPIRDLIVYALVHSDKEAAVSTVLDLLEKYSLTKEDMDSILEFSLWSGENDPMKKVDSKTKAALTRAYNKKDFNLPYSLESDVKAEGKKGTGKKGKKKFDFGSQEEDEGEEGPEENEEETDLLDLY